MDTSTQKAGEAKTALDGSAKTAGEMQETLNATVKQAGALDTSLGEKIKTGTQLKTDLVASGEKAVQDIQTAGSEQLDKMQAVAEEFTADREQITTNKEDIGSLKEDTAVLQKRQNVLVGSETGNPVSCDDAFAAPLCGLTVYGKSTQDGTPTPDAPVPIVSAGDGRSVVVKVTGANMLEGTKPGVKSTVNGTTYTTYENGVLITGTATETHSITLHGDEMHRLTRGIYYLTTRGLSPSVMLNFFYIGKFSSDTQNQQVTLTRDVNFTLQLQILKGAPLNATVQVSLTRDKTTTYSPYREQILTLPTPNGFPGIPVASGGNYTDPQGQQWVCDEVDLERGVMAQRVGKAEITSASCGTITSMNTWATLGLDKVQPFRINTIHLIPNSMVICTALPGTGYAEPWNKTYECIGGAGKPEATIDFCIANERLGTTAETTGNDAIKALENWLETNPFSFIYALVTPIETPLTPAEIAAYKAITAYGPDTVVQASDGAGIKLDYQRDVNLVVKNLEDAIASMTTT